MTDFNSKIPVKQRAAFEKWLAEMFGHPVTHDERAAYEQWLTETESLLGREVYRGGELEMIFLKDYIAGKTSVQASDAYKAVEEENRKPRALKIINRHGVETDVNWSND
jgi:ferric-dicitrate binding protein FerR (iron transport regulator)